MQHWRCLGSAGVVLLVASAAEAQVRVAQWNLAAMRGEPAAIDTVIELLDQDDRPGFASPVSILTIQEADTVTYNYLLDNLGADWSAATYTNSNEDNFGGAQACFYRAATVTEDESGHDDTFTEAGRRADRWLFTLNGYDDPPVSFYVYSAHLKAGNNSSAEVDRNTGAERVIANMTEIPDGSRVIVTGDMNFYDNDEAGYQTFLAGGLEDPIGDGGWAGAGNTLKHSQSPRVIQADGLASGGLDDRFDLHLCTPNLIGTAGMTLIDGSYRSVGNDGQHYNVAINDGSNTYWPGDVAGSNALADALHDASDHLPVVADYRVPAVLDASFSGCDVGTVIEGYPIECSLEIGNTAVGSHAAALNWSLSGTGVLGGNTDAGTLQAGGFAELAIDVDTSAVGAFEDSLAITSDDDLTQHAPAGIGLSGHVLRHANPSFSNTADNDFFVMYIDVECNTGVMPVAVQFWNYQWDSDQARLDVDAVSTPEAPVAFIGGTWSGVGPFAISMPFEIDTTGLDPGNYVRPITVTVSDEDIPGEAQRTLYLTMNITATDVTPACEGDVDGDGITGIGDLLALLAGYGGSEPALDLIEDGVIDVSDLLALLADYGCV